MFSVVLPLYNKEISIRSTLQAVLDQNFVCFEVIIINDGSSDDSINVVKEFNDPRIRIIQQENQGVSFARNKGIKAAKFDWIAFLDADDLWNVDYLKEVSLMISKYPCESFFASGFSAVNGRERTQTDYPLKEEGFIDYYKTSNLVKKYFVQTSAVVVKKNILIEVGMFNINITHGEDIDLWERISNNYALVINPKILTSFRVGAENRSNTSIPKLEKTGTYNFSPSRVENSEQEVYYKRRVLASMLFSLRKAKLNRFLKQVKRHQDFISFPEILVFLAKRIEASFIRAFLRSKSIEDII